MLKKHPEATPPNFYPATTCLVVFETSRLALSGISKRIQPTLDRVSACLNSKDLAWESPG